MINITGHKGAILKYWQILQSFAQTRESRNLLLRQVTLVSLGGDGRGHRGDRRAVLQLARPHSGLEPVEEERLLAELALDAGGGTGFDLLLRLQFQPDLRSKIMI